ALQRRMMKIRLPDRIVAPRRKTISAHGRFGVLPASLQPPLSLTTPFPASGDPPLPPPLGASAGTLASAGGAGTHLCCVRPPTSPLQHSSALRHHCPSATHAQWPPLHALPPQQSVPVVQVAPTGLQHALPYGGLPV